MKISSRRRLSGWWWLGLENLRSFLIEAFHYSGFDYVIGFCMYVESAISTGFFSKALGFERLEYPLCRARYEIR